jgi:hypothetical protein
MNAPFRNPLAELPEADVDLTRIMKRQGIRRIEQRRCGVFTVELFNDCIGSASTVGQALEKAKSPDAYRIASYD